MLTKTDLSQIQSIVQIVVQKETRAIVQKETRNIVKTETKKIIRKELAPIKKDIKVIKVDINMVIESFDGNYLELRARVDRIDDHLGFTASPS